MHCDICKLPTHPNGPWFGPKCECECRGTQSALNDIGHYNHLNIQQVRRTTHCQFSVIENKLAVITENQLKIANALVALDKKLRKVLVGF